MIAVIKNKKQLKVLNKNIVYVYYVIHRYT